MLFFLDLLLGISLGALAECMNVLLPVGRDAVLIEAFMEQISA